MKRNFPVYLFPMFDIKDVEEDDGEDISDKNYENYWLNFKWRITNLAGVKKGNYNIIFYLPYFFK